MVKRLKVLVNLSLHDHLYLETTSNNENNIFAINATIIIARV